MDGTADLKPSDPALLTSRPRFPLPSALHFISYKSTEKAAGVGKRRVRPRFHCNSLLSHTIVVGNIHKISVGGDRLFIALPRRIVPLSVFVTLISYCPQLYEHVLNLEHLTLQAPTQSALSKKALQLQALDIDTTDACHDLSYALFQPMLI